MIILIDKYDPSGTLRMRNKYSAAFDKRLNGVLRKTRQAIKIDDAFQFNNQFIWNGLRFDVAFNGTTTAEILVTFDNWFEALQNVELLDGLKATDPYIKNWTDMYIESVYSSTAERAGRFIEASGTPLNYDSIDDIIKQPHFRDSVQHLKKMNYENFKNIIEDGNEKISRVARQVISDAYREGLSPRQIGGKLFEAIKDRIEHLERWRCDILAETEIVRAHAESSLDMFEYFGIENVTAVVEFTTAMDERVCDECSYLEGRIFTIQEARGIIPVHPRCRCSWLPAELPETVAVKRK